MAIAFPQIEEDIDIEEEEELEPPFKVLIHNDEVTPMDFVIAALVRFFDHDVDSAYALMMRAHITGIGFVGVWPKPEAHKRIGRAHFAASLEGYPLRFTAEPAK